jgi:hypothetical protein
MGDLSAEELLARASARFRYVTLDMITQEDMTRPIQGDDADTAKAEAELYAMSAPGRLGNVDAYLSHIDWQDDADSEKMWAALQAWREEFKAKHADREPKLWIDRFCLNPADAQADRVCWPIYLAGCKHLYISYCGAYLRRLWCVCEVFTFLQMGGLPQQVIMHVTANGSPFLPPLSVSRLIAGFSKFGPVAAPGTLLLLLGFVPRLN